eukprot:gnl/TRDRNA2_/TRDRNA2_173205_c1_seq8.p1 gnl/TRDRNA2_/TRDRNA2_173205_c1~~gnl/TRDRNA2_/TRDRNA2_173205_c1_seq8.p1  ORF type:complete len:362 (-),score=72.53 gnl/TRDRNA2_/TRDRNA2_173205_c1_seq8:450-1535(-)
MTSKTLPQYLASAKKELENAKGGSGKVKVVMGNEAGDLDSMACALVLAFAYAESQDCVWFPVINVPRDELRLRKDNVEVFKVGEVKEEDLIFIDEIPLEDIAKAGRLELTIVDHNELSPRQSYLTKSVTAIIDHHKDAMLYTDTVKEGARNCLFPRGSATSLVTMVLRDTDEKTKACLSDPAVSLMLQSTIMLDTKNLKSPDKTTDLDRDAMKVNRDIVSGKKAWGNYSPSDWHKHLAGLRMDISGFSAVDVMKKDCKFGSIANEQFAIGSAPVSLKSIGVLESKETLTAFAGELNKFMQSNKINSVFALFVETETRQIIAYTTEAEWAHIGKSLAETIASDKEYGDIAQRQAHRVGNRRC